MHRIDEMCCLIIKSFGFYKCEVPDVSFVVLHFVSPLMRFGVRLLVGNQTSEALLEAQSEYCFIYLLWFSCVAVENLMYYLVLQVILFRARFVN